MVAAPAEDMLEQGCAMVQGGGWGGTEVHMLKIGVCTLNLQP